MAKPNYQFEKRQRDLAKKNKQEEKRRQKSAAKAVADNSDNNATENSPEESHASDAVGAHVDNETAPEA